MNKEDFRKEFANWVGTLSDYISSDDGSWRVKGFVDVDGNMFTISSDTKIVSKILEIHLFPEIVRWSDSIGFELVLAEHQNWYPDISLVKKGTRDIKYAIDLKTTFRRGKSAGFTLGSHGAYFKERHKTKNIQFPYSEYSGHFCLGIIYDRREEIDETLITSVEGLSHNIERNKGLRVSHVNDLDSVESVISNFEFFGKEKWEIASDQRGSGNTANIGSVKNLEDLKNGRGVFHQLGESWFDDYWMNYGECEFNYEGVVTKVSSIWDFLQFRNREDLFDVVGNGAKRKRPNQ